MAIVHGNWLLQPQGGCFFVWGETWRRITTQDAFQIGDDLHHPLAMTAVELKTFFDTLQQAGKLNWQIPGDRTHAASDRGTQKRKTGKTKATQTQVTIQPPEASPRWQNCAIALPTTRAGEQLIPQHSAVPLDNPDLDLSLYPWHVEGFCLTPTEAFTFLQALPLGTVADASDRAPGSGWEWLGSDLQFWSHITRWSLDLLARGKYLPALERQPDDSFVAKWQLLLDSATDRNRLTTFARQMPPACRTYQSLGQPVLSTAPAIDLPPLPQHLLQGFLSAIVDSQVRAASQPLTEIKVASPVREWFASLGQAGDRVTADAEMLNRLETALTSWTAPLQNQLSHSQFRTAFHLIPPTSTQTQWSLAYYLQAIDDPDCLVSAKTIWNNPVENLVYQNRTIQFPQETLLSGLGLASKLYPLIEPSLQEQRPQSCSLTPLQAYEFLKSVAWRFSDSGLGIILPPSLANREGWASRLGLSIQAEAPTLGKTSKQRLGLQSLLNFKWELTIGGQRISKPEFDRLVAKNSPLVEIKGEWVELRPQDVKAAQNFFASRQDQMTLSLEDALRLASGDTQTVEKLPVVNFEASGQLQELLNNLTNNQAVGAIVTPPNFRGELRPYQARGVGWLAFLEKWGLGACLADDMGLGKTPQLIAFLLHLQDQDALDSPTLVICPTSVLGNWEREVKKFGPTLKTFVYHGDKRPKGKAFATAIKGKHLVITSYPLVYRDAKELQGVKWQGVVLDEAQNIKNSEAKQSQAVRQLEASFKIALTGTPVENRLQELWSILDFLNPSYLGPRNFFQRRFAIPIEKYGDKESLQTLRSLVRPFILRRLKTDKEIIQDLPEKQEMTIFCPLSSEQASLYQKTVEESLVEIESSEGIQRRGMILALLIKLKQICNHPSQFLKDKTLASQFRSGKLQRLEAMVEELLAEGDRALIFTQFAEWGHLLKPYLEKQLGREILFLYGGTRQQQREEMIDRFQHDPQGPPIMILSLKAGGTGLNLTRATHVFHFDRWWNPAVENQATDRVFRIGQTRNVQVHKFVCTGTLEEKIHDMIESKKALAEQVVGAGEQWLTELDTDQLRNLLILDRNAIIEEEEE